MVERMPIAIGSRESDSWRSIGPGSVSRTAFPVAVEARATARSGNNGRAYSSWREPNVRVRERCNQPSYIAYICGNLLLKTLATLVDVINDCTLEFRQEDFWIADA